MSEQGSYRAVPPRIDLPAMEHEVLDFWRERGIFARSLEATAEGEPWIFYEGPPTANGTPGTHHVEARVFKDVFPRYRTMKGRHVPRRAGWDCHGLPVEIAVEKELGFSGKRDIEAYGVAEFNARCRESVLRHVDEFTVMTERMAYWVDFDDAYWTMNTDYIQSVWWSLQQIFEAGLLVEDHRVSPYCPRCGTGLSDHELAQGYETVVDPSVFVRFPVTSGALLERHPGLTLLVWTTTPWTLVSNTAVAVNPTAEYVVARNADGEVLVVARDLAASLLGDDAEVLESMPGSALERITYSRPFDLIDIPDAHIVVLELSVRLAVELADAAADPVTTADALLVALTLTIADTVPLAQPVALRVADADKEKALEGVPVGVSVASADTLREIEGHALADEQAESEGVREEERVPHPVLLTHDEPEGEPESEGDALPLCELDAVPDTLRDMLGEPLAVAHSVREALAVGDAPAVWLSAPLLEEAGEGLLESDDVTLRDIEALVDTLREVEGLVVDDAQPKSEGVREEERVPHPVLLTHDEPEGEREEESDALPLREPDAVPDSLRDTLGEPLAVTQRVSECVAVSDP